MYQAQIEGVKLLISQLDALCLRNASRLLVLHIAPEELDRNVDIVHVIWRRHPIAQGCVTPVH